jgi:ribonuclease HI
MDQGRTCRNCGKQLIVKQTKRTSEQLKKPYYYSAYYYCPNCNKLYHDEKFKVVNKIYSSLFGSLEKLHPVPRLSRKRAPSPVSLDQSAPLLTGEAYSESFDVKIWTDGACTHNGTPRAKAAWAFVSGKSEHAGLVEGKQTNNRAEGLAIYHALVWAAERKFRKVLLHTDSQISLFNLHKPASKVKMNREIFEDIEKVIAENNLEVSYKKVLGHSGDPNNERADALANGLAAKI